MGDMGEVFNSMKASVKKHRAKMLDESNTEGWTRHTDYHFSRLFLGERIDWWPSGGKAKYKGRMVYGHSKVNALVRKLFVAHTNKEGE